MLNSPFRLAGEAMPKASPQSASHTTTLIPEDRDGLRLRKYNSPHTAYASPAPVAPLDGTIPHADQGGAVAVWGMCTSFAYFAPAINYIVTRPALLMILPFVGIALVGAFEVPA